jgi:hypothetical protein
MTLRSISNVTATWTDSGTVYTGVGVNVYAISYSSTSRPFDVRVNGGSIFSVDTSGTIRGNTVNALFNTANAAYNFANNLAVTTGDPSFAFRHANSAYNLANNLVVTSASAFNATNVSFSTANAAYNFANNLAVSSGDPSFAFRHANAAFGVANASFNKANTALQNTSGVSFNGDFYVPNGNFGVGSSTAYGKFNVVGGRSYCIANSEIYALGVGYNSSTGGYYYLGATNNSTPDLVFSQVGGLERMRITNDGNVGIGVTSPTAKLNINPGNAQYPTCLLIAPTSHASSRRSSITLDNWVIAQDMAGNGTKDFGIYSLVDSSWRVSIDTSGNFNAVGNISGNFPSLFQSSAQANTSADRSLGYSTSWTDHLAVSFTTTKAGPIYAGVVFAMTYESAAVQGEAQFVLSGAASKTSQYMAVAQQSDANRARGAHSMTWMFGNCPAGSYTLTLQVRNNGSGSTWILNNYLGFDTLYTSYM